MKKKIIFLINYVENGGPSRVLLNIINNVKNDFNVTLLTLKDRNDLKIINNLKKNNIHCVELNFSTNKAILQNKNKIIALINKMNCDIIHSNGFICDCLISTKKIRNKKICTIHNNMFEDYIYSYGKIKGYLMIKFHLMALKKLNKIVCCSKTSYLVLSKKISKVSYIRNGIDVAMSRSLELRKKYNIPTDSIVYIYCGALTNGKRILELLELFKNANKTDYLLVLGSGPLTNQVEKYESDNIKILGFKNNVNDYYACSDVYISNSASEGFSISIVEALGHGLLLLLSDIPSHREVFSIDKDNVYLGEIFDSSSFNSKMNIIHNNVSIIDKNKIHDFQDKHLSSKSMANKYKEEYVKLFKEG